MKITVDYSKSRRGDRHIHHCLAFGKAFCDYMDEAGVTIAELSQLTGVSEKTIGRYRICNKEYNFRTVAALCIGLHLYTGRSLQLFFLAKIHFLSLLDNDNAIYLELVCKAYCSDLTVKCCNDYLIRENIKPLTNEKNDYT